MRRTVLILFSCALVGAALVPALSSASRPALLERRATEMSAGGVVSHRVTRTRAEVLRYWTSERMRKARPTGLILGASDRRRIGAPPAPSGPEISIEPTAAEPSVALTRSVRRAKGSGVSPPFVRDEIVNTADAPFRTHGKVYFTIDGSDYVCSGTVITSEDENVVITAGHCVYEPSTGHFATNFMFRPGFRSGTAPFGSWTASELFTTAGWQSEDIFYDVGMALMEPLSGQTLQDTVGARGVVFNRAPSNLEFEAFGYPAAPPFGGGKMYRCTSDFGYSDSGGTGASIAIGCDMNEGSSGGGWVIEESYVNSVVSYGYDGVPNVLFGPYFGAEVENLYDEVAGDGPDPTPTPTPTSTPGEPVEHDVSLTLTMKRHLRATGRMSIPDGYLACGRNAPVEIYRMIDSDTGRYVGEGTTRDDGRFGVKINDRPGRYFAWGPPGPVNDLNLCLEAYAPISRHRHR